MYEAAQQASYNEAKAYFEAKKKQELIQELKSRVDFTHKGNQDLKSRVEKSPMISKKEWQALMDLLKTFGFSCPQAVINQYGALQSLEAAKRTLHKKPNCPGAYFRTVAKNLNLKKIA